MAKTPKTEDQQITAPEVNNEQAPDTNNDNTQAPEGQQPEGEQHQDPAPRKPATTDFSSFSLEVQLDEELPEDEDFVGIGGPTPQLPYRAFFTANYGKALTEREEGKYFTPNSFAPLGLHQHITDQFAKTHGNEPRKLKLGEVRSKVSDQFKKWQDEKNAPADRKLVTLKFADRAEGFTGNDQAFEQFGPGVRFWVVKK
jgi:hypothetical protein